MVDVTTAIVIARPRREVADFAANPDNAPSWYVNIENVEWKTAPPLGPGSRIPFIARFLGKRLVYTYEVIEFIPEKRLTMRTSEGPFPMETTYEWQTVESGTRMTLRNRGTPGGFSALIAPFLSVAVRRATRKDLAALKLLLERRSAVS